MAERRIENIMNLVGDANRYQKTLIAFSTFLYIQITFMLLGSPFVFMNPTFNCSFSEDTVNQAIACPRIDQCQIANDFTLTAHAGLYCEKQTQRNLIQAFIYVGSVLGLFIMNMLSDTKGRRLSFLISFAISILGLISLILGGSFKIVSVMIAAQVLIGFGGYSLMIIGYTIISDMCKDSLRQKAILSMNGVWAVGEMSLFIFYNWYNNWFNFLVYVVLIPLSLLFSFAFFFIVQSPSFLLSKKLDRVRSVESLERISKYNRASAEINQKIKLQVNEIVSELTDRQQTQQQRQVQQSVFNIFKSWKYMKIILIIAVVQICTNMYYYGVQFSLEGIGSDFGTNILLTGTIQAIAYFSFNLFVTKLPRTKGLFFFNLISIILGAFFFFPFISTNKIFASALLCLCRFANTFSQGVMPLLQNQSFPNVLKSTGWGLIQGISQSGSFLAPFIVSGATNLGLNPIIIICGVMIIFGMIPIKFMKETLVPQKQMLDHGQSLLSQDIIAS